jgi:cytochrome c oxidase subunit 4
VSHQVEPAEAAELGHHPGPRQYVVVAVVLAVITAAEVGIYYVEAVGTLLVPALILFAFLKFFLVASWFMHLRFDSKLFLRLFVTGLILAGVVFAVVLVTFFTHLGGATPNVSG